MKCVEHNVPFPKGAVCPKCEYNNKKEEITMKDQHKHIKGYRDLDEDEIALMNEAKELAEQVGSLIEKLETTDWGDPGLDMRWIALGKTDLQKGFMSLIRGIAQPTTF